MANDKRKERQEVEMFIAGLVLDPSSNAPIVILKDAHGDSCLPIWIGLAEATSIATALKKVDMPRPMTHDLLQQAIEDLGGKVVKIFIRDLQNNTFYADIEIARGDELAVIDARPSDAMALAVRVGAPVYVARSVLENAKVTLVAVNPEEMEEVDLDPKADDSESQNFANIEKDKWAELLADMDPDDFKYKM